jgi:NAD(P)H-dependent FMN reductase
MPTLQVIIASVRPSRIGAKVADWFIPHAAGTGKFVVDRVDLVDWNLPMMNEPGHPRMQQYVHEHTKRWSASVASADAFVFVTPEYDFGPPASLINALQYLHVEWAYKPVGLLSYGGVSAGLRSANQLRIFATALNMMPIAEAVSIPFAGKLIDGDRFVPGEVQDKAAVAMVNHLARWESALRPLRSA